MAVWFKTGKKLRPRDLGRRYTRFKLRKNGLQYGVHEELICKSSKLFRDQLQSPRKRIEGDCSICHDPLDAETDEITFCRMECGHNFHTECIEDWRSNQAMRSKCPMCRAPWIEHHIEELVLEADLDPQAVQVYISWLYSGEIFINEAIRYTDAFNVELLKAGDVASFVEDKTFRNSIMDTYNNNMAPFQVDSVDYAFNRDNKNEEMCNFVLESFIADFNGTRFAKEAHQFPAAFTMKLTLALMDIVSATRRPRMRDILKKFKGN